MKSNKKVNKISMFLALIGLSFVGNSECRRYHNNSAAPFVGAVVGVGVGAGVGAAIASGTTTSMGTGALIGGAIGLPVGFLLGKAISD